MNLILPRHNITLIIYNYNIRILKIYAQTPGQVF